MKTSVNTIYNILQGSNGPASCQRPQNLTCRTFILNVIPYQIIIRYVKLYKVLKKEKFLILGAGIQGVCIALELARQGFQATILERDLIPFNRASLRNEGKIHMGLVYMNDTSFATPKLMLRGALTFRKYLERWIGNRSYDLGSSNPFHYLVAQDSFLSPDDLESGYERLQSELEEYRKFHPEWDYLGTNPQRLAIREKPDKVLQFFGKTMVQAAFSTPELAVDTTLLGYHLCNAMFENELIEFMPGHTVQSISCHSDFIRINGLNGTGTFRMDSPYVINTTWENKFGLDQSLGIVPPDGLLHRLKYRVLVKIDANMTHRPSATMVIGKYGDVVIRQDHTAYLSWYPDACTDWSHDIKPPKSWQKASKGQLHPAKAEDLADKFMKAIEKWYPGIAGSVPYQVDAGHIVAYGNTDVDDPESTLHDRTKIGLRMHGNYFSVDTGKLTTAPLFAVKSVAQILNGIGATIHEYTT